MTRAERLCRICGVVLRTQHWRPPLMFWPAPVLPGDVPSRELCDRCAQEGLT